MWRFYVRIPLPTTSYNVAMPTGTYEQKLRCLLFALLWHLPLRVPKPKGPFIVALPIPASKPPIA